MANVQMPINPERTGKMPVLPSDSLSSEKVNQKTWHHLLYVLINAGRGIYEVANLLGHTQLKTTQRYAHLADQTLRDAVNTVTAGKGSLIWCGQSRAGGMKLRGFSGKASPA